MRILEVITLGEIGGAQTVLVDLVRGISERRCNTEIDVVFGSGEYLPQALQPWFKGNVIQTPWLERNISPYKDFRAFFELLILCKKGRYDVVHLHSSKASWVGRAAAYLAGVPKICMTVHGLSFHSGNSTLKRSVYRNVEKIALPLATDYIFVSPSDMQGMESLGLKPSRCKLIPNGRPVPARPTEGLRTILPISDNSPIVCMVARLSEVKNPLAFVRIAKMVIKQYSSDITTPRFVLIGDGPMYEECQAVINQSKLNDFVFLLGHKDDASQYFWDSDLALLTSYYEACPLVAIEALATGTPVIASDVGGTSHVVEHRETGFLYSVDKEAEAAHYIVTLIKNRGLREVMGNKALDRYQKKFTVERMVDEYIRYLCL